MRERTKSEFEMGTYLGLTKSCNEKHAFQESELAALYEFSIMSFYFLDGCFYNEYRNTNSCKGVECRGYQ